MSAVSGFAKTQARSRRPRTGQQVSPVPRFDTDAAGHLITFPSIWSGFITSAVIGLHSGTKTRAVGAMRRAIAEAEVADGQQFEDPTVLRLARPAADLLGQEDAVLLPSGAMANEIAVLLLCVPGDELIAPEWSHLLTDGADMVAAAGRGRFGLLSSPAHGAARRARQIRSAAVPRPTTSRASRM